MISNDGFVPITAIFYAVFHPLKGTQIVHQVPEQSIRSTDSVCGEEVLFNFDTVKNYIIPKPQLCNKLVSFKINDFRVLGYPVNIEGSHYSRNSFNFNFGFVLPYNSDTTPYELAVSRMGKMFRALEEQSLLLSKLDKEYAFLNGDQGVESASRGLEYTPGHTKIRKFSLRSIESLIHQLYQDLNNYSECCIPIDSANSVDIKLFPKLPPPVNLEAHQVPILTVKLNLLIDVVWDPTMVKILPFVNGINSVKQISELAEADYLLTKQCIQHLMHYQCIILVDIFQFSNIYAPTNRIGNFLKTNGMAEECQAYIITTNNWSDPTPFSSLQHTPIPSATPASPSIAGTPLKDASETTKDILGRSPGGHKNNLKPGYGESASPLARGVLTPGISSGFPYRKLQVNIPSKATLFYLYRLLNQGQTIKEWYIQHQKLLANIDIRRFINFGVVRGIIYRVNLYPILHWVTKSLEASEERPGELEELLAQFQSNVKLNADPEREKPSSIAEAGLLKSVVRESNLKMGKKTRTVSFNYHVDRVKDSFSRPKVDFRSSGSSKNSPELNVDDDSAANLDLDVFDSDSDEPNSGHPRGHKDLHENFSDDGDDEEAEAEADESHENQAQLSENKDIVKLIKLVRGSHHFDSICTELQKPRSEVEKLLDKLGAHSVINS